MPLNPFNSLGKVHAIIHIFQKDKVRNGVENWQRKHKVPSLRPVSEKSTTKFVN
jgi:hypothetical protein